MIWLKLGILLLLVAGIAVALARPNREASLGGYTTSLEGRTRGQRMNALRAARALDGIVLESGETFSFNKAVGSWTSDRGYVLAPVSYDGQLVVDWGGGVCQTSTTLYNAALIAGLEIVQRHRHSWSPKYVPPGRDAAVAQITIDLQLRNPYTWPVRILTRKTDDSIGFEILGRDAGPMARLDGTTVSSVPPTEIIKVDPRLRQGQRRVITHGRPGVRVSIYREFRHGEGAGDRELVSQDTYPAMNRVVAVGR